MLDVLAIWDFPSRHRCKHGRDWGQEEKGTTEDEMAGWHHRLNGYEFKHGRDWGQEEKGTTEDEMTGWHH